MPRRQAQPQLTTQQQNLVDWTPPWPQANLQRPGPLQLDLQNPSSQIAQLATHLCNELAVVKNSTSALLTQQHAYQQAVATQHQTINNLQQQLAAAPRTPPEFPANLPAGWIPVPDVTQGAYYYWHKESDFTTWDQREVFAQQAVIDELNRTNQQAMPPGPQMSENTAATPASAAGPTPSAIPPPTTSTAAQWIRPVAAGALPSTLTAEAA